MDLMEVEDIKKKWQEYTELYKKVRNDPDNHNGVITHLESDIMECKVKWALENITTHKATRRDGIPVELFQILMMMLWKCCTQYACKFGKLSSGNQTGRDQFSFQSQRRAMPKNILTTMQWHSSQTLAKYCSKFSKPGFNSTWIENFQMFKLDLEKAEEPEIKLPICVGSQKKQENSRKTSTSASLTMLKALTLWITTNCGKFLKRWEYQTPDMPPEKSVCRSRSNS